MDGVRERGGRLVCCVRGRCVCVCVLLPLSNHAPLPALFATNPTSHPNTHIPCYLLDPEGILGVVERRVEQNPPGGLRGLVLERVEEALLCLVVAGGHGHGAGAGGGRRLGGNLWFKRPCWRGKGGGWGLYENTEGGQRGREGKEPRQSTHPPHLGPRRRGRAPGETRRWPAPCSPPESCQPRWPSPRLLGVCVVID